MRCVFPETGNVVQLPTPEIIQARETYNRRKYGEHFLQKATDVCEKIYTAAVEATLFFPGNCIFKKDPATAKAELTVILDFVSRQLFILMGNLACVHAVHFPIEKDLNLFQHILDRLILMTTILTRNFSRVHTARLHYRTPADVPPAPSFSLLSTCQNAMMTHDEILETYVQAGLKVAAALFDLHEKMSSTLLNEATSAERKNDLIGSWLAKEMYRFASREGEPVDIVNEPALLMFAFWGYNDLRNDRERQRRPNVKKFLSWLEDQVILVHNSRTNPSTTHAKPRDTARTKALELMMYIGIGRFGRTNYRDRLPTTEQQKKDSANIDRFDQLVEHTLARVGNKDLPNYFTGLVKRARETLPFARPEQILELAKEVYYTGNVALFDQAGKPKTSTPVKLIPRNTPIGERQNPNQRTRASGGKSKDVLRKVKERMVNKRYDKMVRLASPPLSWVDGGLGGVRSKVHRV